MVVIGGFMPFYKMLTPYGHHGTRNKRNGECSFGYVYHYGKNLLDALDSASHFSGIRHHKCVPKKTEIVGEDEFAICAPINFWVLHFKRQVEFHKLPQVKRVVDGILEESAVTGRAIGQIGATLIEFYKDYYAAVDEKNEILQARIESNYQNWIHQQYSEFQSKLEEERNI